MSSKKQVSKNISNLKMSFHKSFLTAIIIVPSQHVQVSEPTTESLIGSIKKRRFLLDIPAISSKLHFQLLSNLSISINQFNKIIFYSTNRHLVTWQSLQNIFIRILDMFYTIQNYILTNLYTKWRLIVQLS